MNDHPPSPQTRRRASLDDGSTPPPEPATVLVTDEQASDRDAFPIDVTRWRSLASAVLSGAGLGANVELSVLFVDEAAMADLNERFMGHEGPTDVLAFPIDDEESIGDGMPRLVGDVVICPSVASQNAADHAGSYDDEVALLLVHGILHLLGMDHADKDDRMTMQARERELLAAHHGPLARDPWS